MDLIRRVTAHFDEGIAVKHAAAGLLAAPIAEAIELMTGCLINNGKILACGNGGSAGDAQHFAAELVDRFESERQELAAIALTGNQAVLTAIANNHGFASIFSKQIRALGQPGDVLLAISTSGNSANITEAIRAAHAHELSVIVLTGNNGGRLVDELRQGDIMICVPAERTARIQEVHLLVIHCLCDGIDALLLGVED